MTKATYTRTTETETQPPRSDGGILDFPSLDSGNGTAHVAVTIGYGLDYGIGKCSVTVQVACDQEEAVIDRAADMLIHKASELACVGMEVVQAELEKSRG